MPYAHFRAYHLLVALRHELDHSVCSYCGQKIEADSILRANLLTGFYSLAHPHCAANATKRKKPAASEAALLAPIKQH